MCWGWTRLPWQEWVLRRGLVQAKGRWASRTVGVVVARQNGKTSCATIRTLGGMALWGENVIGAAQNRDIALEAWRDALEVALDAGLAVREVKRATGREEFSIGRARYKVVSSTRRGGRGLHADLVILDEVREYRDWEAWAALEKTRRARPSSQVWAISNEGDDGSVVLNALGEEGRAAARSGAVTDVAWFEWSAPPGLERTDPEGWRASNPALGQLITMDTIASEAAHDPPEVFETEVLVPAGGLAASLAAGGDLGRGQRPGDRARWRPGGVQSLDAGPELRHASIAVGWRRPDGRVHVEAVDAFAQDQGPVLARAGVRLAELAARWTPYAVVVAARSPADAAASRALEELEIPVVQAQRRRLDERLQQLPRGGAGQGPGAPTRPDDRRPHRRGVIGWGLVPAQQVGGHRRRGGGRLRPPRCPPRRRNRKDRPPGSPSSCRVQSPVGF